MCPNHPDRPVKSRGLCGSCYDRELKRENPEYAERQRQNRREWGERPESQQKMRDNEARYRRKYGSRAHREYGITREEYDAYMAKPCGICGEPSKHLDHNHTTGEIRGGLCHRCNLGLGYYEGWFLEHRHAALKWIGAE